MEIWMHQLLEWLALPQFGLSTVFAVSFVSATLLPLGSEPAVFGLVKINPDLFWPAIFVATAGNTLGGGLSWWLGLGAHKVLDKVRRNATETRALNWLRRFGARACLLSWLPMVGDPLCAVAGWLKLPFWPCLAYMAVGKFFRYLIMTYVLLYFMPGNLRP
ncbi:YqaA family protein [Verminephrobacter aporrectodeae]|uniref:DedA family protein n=2 Tax=Verminephrobacter TaxID=364316 RepID=A0ABT3KPE9_9BURK|nr:YqaA family protein [Verminephrobacter aporrectodeae]MCW5255171.1 DedA family protein [Verminephrobacter aporrectodeae subsp. tuberculatae]MCW5320189.1 DedA family protein [Verminephrobacter aporrectodeae subsp. tuberculatae]MCW8164128.1 DedA family protein [Verminephrobacter aporrectodeae subsp. tuberculatae]MCW8168273.1 DedA family protein [Verminephrobacter aporrectodeae subsp. tuberculatae]MCW8174499.1 DedA family protein [Verminephrobacter aporrectodeae subsp. tuberculatae]